MSSIEFVLVPPPPSLARDVSCLRLAHRNGDDSVQVKVCPNGTPGMVLNLCGAEPAIASIATRSVEISEVPRFFVHGQGSEPSLMNFKPGEIKVLQVALKPQALSTIFGFDASALPQGFLTAEDIGAKELVTRLVSAPSDQQMMTEVWAFLEQKLAKAGVRDTLVETGLELIHRHGTMTVQDLLARLPISARQFEKRFARVVGCPPQKYIRVKRINEALRLMKTGEYERLSDIAYALNFYDQSHFIREIKTFSWLTPKLISQKVSEFQQDETGSSWE